VLTWRFLALCGLGLDLGPRIQGLGLGGWGMSCLLFRGGFVD
jgi:hypothetical protein